MTESPRSSMSMLLSIFNNIPSPRQLVQLPFLLLSPLNPQQEPIKPTTPTTTKVQSCPNPSLSCPLEPPYQIDSCCTNNPAGHFLLAQFWDTSPSLGPNNSWTLHGLWPDYCTGGFPANCDHARALSASTISGIVDDASKTTHPTLRKYMDTFWKGLHGDDDLWSHEWNKHGTCVSTLNPSCYDSYGPVVSSESNHTDLLDYLTAATTLHSTLQTYALLAAHDIVPSYTQTYSLREIQNALASAHANHSGTVKCNGRRELNEIWLHYTTNGPLRDSSSDPEDVKSVFVPVVPDGLVSNCPAEGIRYIPKSGSSPPPGHGYPPPPGSGTPFEDRGHLMVHVLSEEEEGEGERKEEDAGSSAREGCLIRQGQWYASGTCATYRAKPDVIDEYASSAAASAATGGDDDDDDEGHLFTLQSSYAPCAILEADGRNGKKGEFVCANRLPVQSIFGVGKAEGGHGEVLSWKNKTVFFADERPGRFQKVKVFGDDDDGERRIKLEIFWQSA